MRNVCVFTSTRADYGLLRGVIRGVNEASDLRLQILASGSHLSPDFGMTIAEIRNDGYEPDQMVEMLLSSDSKVGVTKSMGLALIGYGEALNRLGPDLAVVLGDRFETLCFAVTAHVLGIPLAHLCGGETTEGAIDEAFRHAITKMASLHFASCEIYRKRIIQLGEAPERVFNVGAPGIENIRNVDFMGLEDLAASIAYDLHLPFFMVTYHPETLEQDRSATHFRELLQALDHFSDHQVLFTKANADAEGRIINFLIDEYVAANSDRCVTVASLGMRRYLSAVRFADVVIGNSSSGIVEVPTLKVPTVNIGDRQRGREQAASVVDCRPWADDIRAAIANVLRPDFRRSLAGVTNPYEQEGTAEKIIAVLRSADTRFLKKRFYDIPIAGL